jgi:hypothetical protein
VRQRQVTGMIVAAAVVAAGAAVVALNWPGGPPPSVAQPAPPPVKARLHSVDLVPHDPRARSIVLPARDTGAFSMLGITWTDPAAVPGGAVQVRTRAVATGAWSPWRALDSGDSQGPDSGEGAGRGVRGGTAPLWVGASNGVAARIAGGKAATGLPAGMRLDLIDPTEKSAGQGGGEVLDDPSESPSADVPSEEPTPSAPATEPSTVESPSATPTTSTAPSPVTTTKAPAPVMGALPPYVSRGAWKADESIVTGATQYTSSVKVLFVHHTAGTNDYSCTDSAAIVRGILAYHVQSQHWNDIGYNFLVDKCGKLFEGRRGGVDKPVLGAHTYGFNTDSAAVAVLGTYIKDRIPAVTQTVIAQVAAYKLGRYGFDPSTSARLTESAPDGKFPKGTTVSFARISGHRDAVATECPGDALYAQLADIRTDAASVVYGFIVAQRSGYVRGSASLSWSVGTPTGLLSRFELLVDGRIVSIRAATARSAAVALANGTHKLAPRAGTVVSDVTAPSFPRLPELTLRTGTVSTSAVPVTLFWRAADNIRLGSVAVTAPAAKTFPAATTSWAASAKPGARTWRMTARDAAGNAGASSATRNVALLAETSAKKSGTWAKRSGSAYLNGKALTASKKNAKLTFAFTGRSAALVVSRGTGSGKIDVYVDGKKAGTLDLRYRKTLYRQAIWAKTFTGSAKHTVMLKVQGTKGRAAVTVDGLVYVR